MAAPSFCARLKQHQIDWAKRQGFGERELDLQSAPPHPWVLKKRHRELNLFDPSWWRFIRGKEHRWAHALTSSQCFAVNLFAPQDADPSLARAVYTESFGHRPLEQADEVGIAFEVTPDGTKAWLGEGRQPTQVDVVFTVRRNGRTAGHGLVEVKLGEREFGSCRGAKPGKPDGSGNPRPERCRDFRSVYADPARNCWLTEVEGRCYWELIRSQSGCFRFDAIGEDGACPFRGSLYQLMRNSLLALCLVEHTDAEWSDLAICIHPENRKARQLGEAVAGEEDAIRAFNQICTGNQFRELDPRNLLQLAVEHRPVLTEWAGWMQDRYMLT